MRLWLILADIDESGEYRLRLEAGSDLRMAHIYGVGRCEPPIDLSHL
jgi:hypothetical protein